MRWFARFSLGLLLIPASAWSAEPPAPPKPAAPVGANPPSHGAAAGHGHAPAHGNASAAATATGKTPDYSPELVQSLVADAQHHGNARNGAIVFSLATSACQSCHKVGEHGGNVGPELSKIGQSLKPDEIIEAVLWPNRTVKPEFKAVAITTVNEQIFQGIIREETADAVVLVTATGQRQRIAKADIDDRREIGSLMPEGLTAPMSAEQRRDLLRYLMDLGRDPGLAHLSHQPAKWTATREPLHPENWPNWTAPVNRDRVYDYYTKQALHFRGQQPMPLILPDWPGLDGGKQGHWGNQNDTVWKDNRWNSVDLGTLQSGVFRAAGKTIPRAVCVRLGNAGEMAICFNQDTLQIEAIWTGGFVRFTDHRYGFLDGIQPVGTLKPLPPVPAILAKPGQPIRYRGVYRDGKRVVFAYRIGDTEYLDAPWVENGQFSREIAPVSQHSLAKITQGGAAQWPQIFPVVGKLGQQSPYTVDTIPPPAKTPWNSLFFFGGNDFFRNGTAAVVTMQGDVWTVAGLDESLKAVRWRRMAAGLHQGLGLVIHDEKIYALGRDQITRLHDLNGDGEADFYECFSNAYFASPAGHDYTCGLERDAQGNFYTASSKQGLIRISADGQRVDVLATGFRNPAGIGLTPEGLLTVPCSEGEWTPASMICGIRPSSSRVPFFGYGGPRNQQAPDLPLIYLPRGLDNSSGGQLHISSNRWGPLQGQMLHFSYGTGTHLLLLRDEVDGQLQGGVVPLPGDFRSGVHRGRFSPTDGQLYVTGMTGWGAYVAEDGCFQRVRFTGQSAMLPTGFHIHANGVRITFSEPLNPAVAAATAKHFAQCWNYRYSAGYGSREFSPSHEGTPGHDPLTIRSAHRLADGRSLFLEIPDLQPVNVLHLLLEVGTPRPVELFLTVHRLDAPFRDFPGYRETPKTIAAHPILKDLAFAMKREPNPWRQPIANARPIIIEAGKNLTYATPMVRVKAGEALKLTFRNPDVVPHNWALIRPGTLAEVGALTNQMIADPSAVLRHYVPRTDKVLAYTDIVNPDDRGIIFFHAPKEKGRYPFLCTFPGHWMVMNGEMLVE
ncbi:DUF6797 domain-containing protein [Tuwongella immobilis]|uniref:Cytochrome c domain-containing protein n=1 Tax=Tuwongella immobilis TaxID=692036 RepID=A0A6C2YJZ2_9BACT|nr:DUF6797 domain-containing protein [Tuwongella immobilis]VIP01262.1 multifunctional secreted protein : Putative heme-binding domain-containing protein OS=Singulisphaera acidiphila (strain ATCC BAA-1392 / DSM 18658 / VKM B-2454 / MOB10) GN=Sinac_6971 PE=4 SV=1: Cytochrom_C: Copper-bind [Tuwongella immobilis]VTR97950.1 multifunctional secreted protein : Putative heme-binding domain-containing protein OS=Singulisphaera acidiphila (strain ATCC BAA-1392 / DSM 18658 / VKM B-2454 / MOB10) GN=Sinac_697